MAFITYFIFPVSIFPAYCIPVSAMYILKISLVPYKQRERKENKQTELYNAFLI